MFLAWNIHETVPFRSVLGGYSAQRFTTVTGWHVKLLFPSCLL
jgi:hypothetical protein